MICYYCPYWQPSQHSHIGDCTHSDCPVPTNGISDCIYGLEQQKEEEERNEEV